MNGDRPFWRSGSALFGLAVLVVVVVTDVVLRHMAGTPADFTLFVGRFHPLAVHLPIGIVLLVGAAEAASLSARYRARVDPAIALTLPLLVAATAGTFLLGHLLARSGDFSPRVLNVHRRAELFAAVGICLCPLVWAYQAKRGTSAARWAYRGLLGLTLTVLSLGAHFGGSLTHGETYLTRYAPGPLKGLLGAAETKAPAASSSAATKAKEPRLYADVLAPLFTARCVPCHGSEKVKGGLRLDSLDAITKGGEDGTVVTAGAPADSPLLARLLLPADDDDHMPPEGKPGLTPAQVALIRFWIERGANDNLLVRDLLLPADARKALEEPLGDTTPTAVSSAASSPASSTPSATAPSTPASAPSSVLPTAAPAGSAPPSAPVAPHAASSAPSAHAVLMGKCEKCHGASKQKSKLRVDSLEALLTGGKSGAAIVPGNPAASKLMAVVQLPIDDEKHMPPKKEPQLEPAEIHALSAFISGLSASTAHPTSPASAPKAANAAAAVSKPSASASTNASAADAATPAAADVHPAPAAPDAALLASVPQHVALYPTAIASLFHGHCDQCHSGKNPSGGLSVAPYAALLRGGDAGPALTPGKPKESLLVSRISVPLDDGDHMPPEGEAQLSGDEIALVTAWVEHGASENAQLETATLPAAAVRALAAHPPARDEPNAASSSASTVAASAPQGRSGGCAACVVADRGAAPSFTAWLGGALGATLALRRKFGRTHARRRAGSGCRFYPR